MKSNFINIYFSLTKVVKPNSLNNKLIKLISSEYFVSPLKVYEFHLKNICSINTKCGCLTY